MHMPHAQVRAVREHAVAGQVRTVAPSKSADGVSSTVDAKRAGMSFFRGAKARAAAKRPTGPSPAATPPHGGGSRHAVAQPANGARGATRTADYQPVAAPGARSLLDPHRVQHEHNLV